MRAGIQTKPTGKRERPWVMEMGNGRVAGRKGWGGVSEGDYKIFKLRLPVLGFSHSKCISTVVLWFLPVNHSNLCQCQGNNSVASQTTTHLSITVSLIQFQHSFSTSFLCDLTTHVFHSMVLTILLCSPPAMLFQICNAIL